jgi:hypothetical protein
MSEIHLETADIPTRFQQGLVIQTHIDRQVQQLADGTRWGIIRADAGQFIVPDAPGFTIIPITPVIALSLDALDATLTDLFVKELAQMTIEASTDYCFGQDLSGFMSIKR